MLCTEILNVAEITPHVSPSRTVYSKGGNGVSVGIGVEVGCSVAVDVMVAVAIAVPSEVGVTSVAGPMPEVKMKYTAAAPINKIVTSAPSAAGRLSVISGMRLACTAVSVFFDFVAALAVSSVPHTRQRVAFSLKRVPHVGQICDF